MNAGKGRVPRTWKHPNSSSNFNSLQALVWGDGKNVPLGLGNETCTMVLKPVLLPGIGVKKDGGAPGETVEGELWHQVACGDFHTAAVTPTGELYTWGDGDNYGQLGHGNNEHELTKPKVVTCLIGKKVIHVNCGDRHTAMVTTEGELYTCGKGDKGQLGHGNLNHLSTFTKVEGLDGHIVSQVVCSDEYTIVLTSEGSVFTFGTNQLGQIGHGSSVREMTPKRVTGCLEYKKVVFVAANGSHVACIDENGDTYTWGTMQLSGTRGGNIFSYSPQLVSRLAGKKAKQVACGCDHTIVCTEDGKVYSFGYGGQGQLGHCSFQNKENPTLVQQAPLEGKCVVQVACGWTYTLALTSDGRLYTWGCGESGCLGHGSELSCTVPTVVESLLAYKVVQIVSKNIHSVVLVEPKNVHSVALVEPKRSSYVKKMKAMVNDETCSDVVFLLKDNERVYANKGLLIGQSDYFRAMFRSGMKDESIANEVELLRDCSKSVFLLFLEYLYSGEVDIGMDNAMELYALSNRYREDDLSMKCLGMIEIGLSDTNAIELLVEADGSGLDILKDVCIEYVVTNYGKCFKKERIVSLSPSLMEELLCKIGE